MAERKVVVGRAEKSLKSPILVERSLDLAPPPGVPGGLTLVGDYEAMNFATIRPR